MDASHLRRVAVGDGIRRVAIRIRSGFVFHRIRDLICLILVERYRVLTLTALLHRIANILSGIILLRQIAPCRSPVVFLFQSYAVLIRNLSFRLIHNFLIQLHDHRIRSLQAILVFITVPRLFHNDRCSRNRCRVVKLDSCCTTCKLLNVLFLDSL